MKLLRTVFNLLAFAVFCGLVYVSFRNQGNDADIDLVVTRLDDISVSVIALLAILAGTVLSLFFAFPEWLRLRLKIRELEGRAEIQNDAGTIP